MFLQFLLVDEESYVALPFITETVTWHFVAHSLLHEDAQLAVVFDLDQFLRPIGRVGNVQLHLVGGELIGAVKTDNES